MTDRNGDMFGGEEEDQWFVLISSQQMGPNDDNRNDPRIGPSPTARPPTLGPASLAGSGQQRTPPQVDAKLTTGPTPQIESRLTTGAASCRQPPPADDVQAALSDALVKMRSSNAQRKTPVSKRKQPPKSTIPAVFKKSLFSVVSKGKSGISNDRAVAVSPRPPPSSTSNTLAAAAAAAADQPRTCNAANVKVTAVKKRVFIDGAPDTAIKRYNEISETKQLGLEFVRVFDENVRIYIVDWENAKMRDIFKSVEYYKSLGLQIPILNGAYLKSLSTTTGKEADELSFEVGGEKAPMVARTRKEKLFHGFNFIFFGFASFHSFKFTMTDMMTILRLSGGSVQAVGWEEVMEAFKCEKKRKGLLGRETKQGDGSGKKKTLAVVSKMEWNHSRFNEIYYRLGVETVNVSYFLDCLDQQQILELDDRYKCYTKEIQPMLQYV